MAPSFTVRTACWPDDADTLRAIRHEVFVLEQSVPPDIEWDGRDPDCLHAIAQDAQHRAIGCGRLLPDGHVGRMAVRRAWRRGGVGRALLRHLVTLAREHGHAVVALNAQVHALDFYAREGFAPDGPVFMEAGIAHQAMTKRL